MKNRLKNNKMMYVVLAITIMVFLFLSRAIYNLTFNGMSVKFQMNSGPELLVMNESYDVGLINKLTRKDLVGVTDDLYSTNGPILMGDKKYRVYFEIVGKKQYDSPVNFDLIKIRNVIPYRSYLLLVVSCVVLFVFVIVLLSSIYYDVS